MTFDNQSSFAGNEASTVAANEEVKVAEGPADAVKLDDIFELARSRFGVLRHILQTG